MHAQIGDYIRHPDDNKLYRVDDTNEGGYVLDDGRHLSDSEIDGDRVLLESEAYDEFHRQER